MEQFTLRPWCRVKLDHTFDQVTYSRWAITFERKGLGRDAIRTFSCSRCSVCSLCIFILRLCSLWAQSSLCRLQRSASVGVAPLDCWFLTLNRQKRESVQSLGEGNKFEINLAIYWKTKKKLPCRIHISIICIHSRTRLHKSHLLCH